MTKKELATFWVTNTSNMNVTLSDLALNIPAYRTVNLLDHKHYPYTMEQLQKSAAYGSLFKKRNKIAIRKIAPDMHKKETISSRQDIIPSRERSVLEITEEKYEELQTSDEEFADEASVIETEKD